MLGSGTIKSRDYDTRPIVLAKYREVVLFIEANKRNPSRYDANERGLYVNWLRHNRKLLKAGLLKEERVEIFKELLAKMEEYKRINQYE